MSNTIAPRTSPTGPSITRPEDRLQEAKELNEELKRSAVKRPLFSCVPKGAPANEKSRTTYFVPDSVVLQNALEIAAAEGKRGRQSELLPVSALGTAGQALSNPTPAIDTSGTLRLTFDMDKNQNVRQMEYQLSGTSAAVGFTLIRTAYSTTPFTFDARGEAKVTMKTSATIGAEHVDQTHELKCKLVE
jgi:hypothetical protein